MPYLHLLGLYDSDALCKASAIMKKNIRHIFLRRTLVYTFLLSILNGCGGGGSGSGGNVTLTTDNQGGDPVIVEIPVAYIRRPVPEEPSDLRDPLGFSPGATLFVRERSATSAEDLDITAQIAAIVAAEEEVGVEEIALDIKGLESSFDGNTLIFAVRAVPEPVDDNLEDSTWNLWTYNIEERVAQYVIPSRIKRNEGVETGAGHDIAPYFLPDDRIVFSSTRQVASQGRQLNEGRIQLFAALDEDRRDPAAVLHLYDPQLRGDEFKQISFNLSHDLDPMVLAGGAVVFSRWNNTATDHISLFRINPEGLALSPLYGFHSQNSGTEGSRIVFSQPRELDDGRLVSVVRPFTSATLGGDIVIIDTANYTDFEQATWENLGLSGTGQESLTETDIRTDGLLSRGGQFGSVYPLRDGTQRLLVTWSDCRVIDEDADPDNQDSAHLLPCTLQVENENQAPPLYGAWLYSPVDDTQRPVVVGEEGFLISEIIAAEPRDFASLVPRPEDFNNELALQNQGQILIDSVYDVDGEDQSPEGIAQHAQPGTPAYASRPARFLRIVQPVPIPDRDVFEIPDFAAGVSGGSSFREILGYVPVEPDGSVTVTLPANRPFTFSVLDERGRRIGARHDYWLQLGAGEVLRCTGCHDESSGLPHGRFDSQPPSSNPGAVALGSGGLGFPGTRAMELFATETGESMAEVWDFHRPGDNAVAVDRQLNLDPAYADEWYDLTVTPSPTIDDRGYRAEWTDIPLELALIVNNFDPDQPSRIVINYIDHIQTIWERPRDPRGDVENTFCIGCHTTTGDTLVAAGQLDLTAEPSDIDPDHYRSYRELLSQDDEQWLSVDDALTDRQRICTELDDEGNEIVTTETVPMSSAAQAGFANGSARFFNCFEGGSCGPPDAPALPRNCTEEGGTPVPSTRNTFNHDGILSEAELRLVSEWLDIGAQYYNNPFDSRLIE